MFLGYSACIGCHPGVRTPEQHSHHVSILNREHRGRSLVTGSSHYHIHIECLLSQSKRPLLGHRMGTWCKEDTALDLQMRKMFLKGRTTKLKKRSNKALLTKQVKRVSNCCSKIRLLLLYPVDMVGTLCLLSHTVLQLQIQQCTDCNTGPIQ